MSKSKTKTHYFSDMSVGDILLVLGEDNDLCSAKVKYTKFGKDLEAAFKAAVKDGVLDTILDIIDEDYANGGVLIPDAVVAAIMPFIKPGAASKETVKDALQSSYFENDWFKDGGYEINFPKFKEALFTYLKSEYKNHGITLQKTRSNRKTKKAK